jgi:glycosyltransferase involved in cell wall biosynthesis
MTTPERIQLQCTQEGATRARNLGVKSSRGAVVVFIDSDLVVTSDFLHAHGAALLEAHKQDGDDRAFTYGRVINTSNFERPEAENFKLTVYFLYCISLPCLILVSLRICQPIKLEYMKTLCTDNIYCKKFWSQLISYLGLMA